MFWPWGPQTSVLTLFLCRQEGNAFSETTPATRCRCIIHMIKNRERSFSSSEQLFIHRKKYKLIIEFIYLIGSDCYQSAPISLTFHILKRLKGTKFGSGLEGPPMRLAASAGKQSCRPHSWDKPHAYLCHSHQPVEVPCTSGPRGHGSAETGIPVVKWEPSGQALCSDDEKMQNTSL